MSNMRTKAGVAVSLLLAGVVVAFSGYEPVRAADGQEWTQYQREFKEYCAKAGGALRELAAAKEALKEVVLADAGVKDLCTSCHLGIDNPLLEDAPQPFRSHSGKFLEQHKVSDFGCTLCHRGQGDGTTVEAAHGTGDNALIPAKYAQSTCATCHDTSFMLEGAEKLEQGRLLFSGNACYACHAARGFEANPKAAGPLDEIGTKLSNASWLENWIREPAKLRPQTRMPNFKLADDEVGDLTAYLFSLKAETPPKASSLRGASADTGEKLFINRGCRGCHSTEKDTLGASARVPNLAGIGLKVTEDWLMAWLEDPFAYNPEALMPKVELTEEERADLTAYLMALKSNNDVVKPDNAPDLAKYDAENGKKLAETYGCYGCHALRGLEQKPLPGATLAAMAVRPLADLSFGDAKVARTKWDWIANKIASPRIYQTEDTPQVSPAFTFSEDDVEALTTYYLNNARAELPAQLLEYASNGTRNLERGEWIVETYNCRGCHALEEDQKTIIEDHLELKSMNPPRLVGEGARVQPQWFCEFIREPFVLRPWLDIRMPKFALSHEDHATLARYFALSATDSEDTFPYVVEAYKDTVTQEEADMGKYRVATDKCVQCHPITFEGKIPEDLTLEDLSIDLLLTKKRLRFDWVKDFLRNPDKYVGAGTKMPFVFYDPDGRPKIPDPEMWIDLTAKFLMVMDELPQPVKETLEEIRPGSQKDWTSYNE